MEYLSKECYEQLVAELEDMINVQLPRVKTAIAEARAQGDLSEILSIMPPSASRVNSWAASASSRMCCSMPA